MNAANVFVDTNVLLHGIDAADPAKRERSQLWMRYLWDTGTGRLSWQVLHEFYVNATRKLKNEADPVRQYVKVLA